MTVTDGEGTSYTDSPWLQGQTIETSKRDDVGSSQERVFHEYWTHDTAQYEGLPDARFVREAQTTTLTKISTGWREHVVQNEYDADTATSATYGLPLRVDDQGEKDVSDNRCTTYGRAYDTDLYDGSSVQRWTVLVDETRHYAVGCDSRAAGNQDGYAATLYDNAASVDGNKPVDGNPTELRTYTTSTAYQKVKHDYDDAGRVIWTDDGKDNRTTTTYTPDNSWPVDGITTTTPDPDGPAAFRGPLTSTVWMSRFWGVPYQSKDANGNITKVTLDAAGRAVEVWKPTETGSSPSSKFSYSIPTSTSGGVPDSVDGYPRVSTQTLQSGTTYLALYAYTDGLGRARETQASIPDGIDPSTGEEVPNRQVAVTRYDTAGNVTGTSAVFRNQGTAGSGGPASPEVADLPSYNDLYLDWAGRIGISELLVKGVVQDAGRVATTYNGDYTSVMPAVGTVTDTYTDVYGQTSKVVEYSNSAAYTTQYTYTATGSLKQITDPRGNNTIYTYDWAGQRTSVDDPDAGKSTTEYDANGQISKTTSNIGSAAGSTPKTVLTYGYDYLGRKTSVTSGADELAVWTWDGMSVPGGKGQITSTTSRDADGNTYTTKVNSFDGRGRSESTTVSIPANVNGLAGDYKTSYTYDAADHVTSVNYPAAGGLTAESVTTAYNTYGQPRSLTSDQQTYVKSTVYDAYGRLTDRYYGLPTAPLGSVTAQRSYSYDDSNGTRWLQGISTTTTVNTLIKESQKDTYSYDLAGKITQLREQASGQADQSQCYTYDAQARLASAFTHSAACGSATTSDFTGEAPYQTAYSYDRLGNLQSVTDTDSAGKATTRDYLYPGYDDAGTWTTANADSPHGVRKINHIASGSTTGTDTFTYNDDGQMTKRVEPDATTDYAWTKLGQLSKVTTTKPGGSELTRYAYDADGALLVRTTPQETVAYVGGMELRTTDGKTVTATRYYTSGGATVAMRTTTGNTTANGKLTYLMADNQASTQLAIDAATGTATRRRYTPFGDERSGTLPTGTNKGFLGKTEDTSTGLSLLGARAYDPELGRFLSPDPLSALYDPQNLSAYSYSGNDPVNNSDPSGLTYQDDGSGFDECQKPDGCVRDVSNDEGAPIYGDAWETEGTVGGDLNKDGMISVYPGVELPATYDNAQEYIDAFYEQIDMLCSGDRWCYTDLNQITSRISVAGANLDACHAVGCSQKAHLFKDWASQVAVFGFTEGIGNSTRNSGWHGGGGCANSFTPETAVAMADGAKKAIKDIKSGDEVIATDPETGVTEAHIVLATIITKEDKDFTELTVEISGSKSKVTATGHHPFWSPSERAWVDASGLKSGMTLLSEGGSTVTVDATRSFHQLLETRNLTVDGIHTYYVLAGNTPVLVHNSSCPRVIGNNPDYQRVAAAEGGQWFEVRLSQWNKLTPEQQWAENLKFLDRGIAEGATFRLATPVEKSVNGSIYHKEINHLLNNGYTFNAAGNALIPGR